MKQYTDGETYIIYVRQFGLPASNSESYHVRAKCVGGNNLDVGYFVDADDNEFNSSMQCATLESEFILDRDVIDTHPSPNLYAKKVMR
jgi:hypothetical protein